MNTYFRQDVLTVPDGASLFYEVQGEGEPAVVLCDGLGCDGFVWKYLLPYLRREHRVVRWHYRGHGHSGLAADTSRLGMFHNCDDLMRVMDAAGIQKTVVFGHSMGVQVALEFHSRNGARVEGLVLLCGSYGAPLDTFHGSGLLKRVFPYVRQAVELFPRHARQFTRALFSSELAMQVALTVELNRALLQRGDLIPYFNHLSVMDPVVFVRTLASLDEHTAREHLPHIRVPTLVVGGQKDKFTPVNLSRQMAQAIPGAEFLLLPDGTHTAPLEQPELLELRLGQFLRRHFRPNSSKTHPPRASNG